MIKIESKEPSKPESDEKDEVEEKKIKDLDLFEKALRTRPNSNAKRIVFPWIDDNFSKSEFSPASAKERVTEEEIDRVLTSLKRIKAYNPKQPYLNCLVYSLFIIVSIMIFLIVILLGVSILSKNSENKSSNIVILVVLDIVFILCFICLINFFVVSMLSKQEEMRWKKRQEEIFEILEKFNKNEFSAKGIKWSVGEFGAWVMLQFEISYQQFLKRQESLI